MKAERDNRRVTITDLPEGAEAEGDRFEVDVRYTGDGNVGKALVLDHLVMPVVANALGCSHEAVMEVHQKTALEISDEIGEEFKKLGVAWDRTDIWLHYQQIVARIEQKYGAGSVMLALRALAGWVHREKAAKAVRVFHCSHQDGVALANAATEEEAFRAVIGEDYDESRAEELEWSCLKLTVKPGRALGLDPY